MPRRVSAASQAINNQPHALYRFFDRTDALLYVGITVNLPSRIKQHRNGKPWWTQVTNITIEPFGTREAALAAEKNAIRDEKPLYNDQHNEHVWVEPGTRPEDIDGNWIEQNWDKVDRNVRDHVEVPAWLSGRYELADQLLDAYTPDQLESYYSLGRSRAALDGETGLGGPEASVRALEAAISETSKDLACLSASVDLFVNTLSSEIIAEICAGAPDAGLNDIRLQAWFLNRLAGILTRSAALPARAVGSGE